MRKLKYFNPYSFNKSLWYTQVRFFQQQANKNWCWAACTQYILKKHKKIIINQEILAKSLMERVFSSSINLPAEPADIVIILKTHTIKVYWFKDDKPENIHYLLSLDHKLIVSLKNNDSDIGHMIVMEKSQLNGLFVVKEPANGKTYEFDWKAFKKVYKDFTISGYIVIEKPNDGWKN